MMVTVMVTVMAVVVMVTLAMPMPMDDLSVSLTRVGDADLLVQVPRLLSMSLLLGWNAHRRVVRIVPLRLIPLWRRRSQL